MAELRAFLVAADELHFGRAAERLLISPSRVSQLIWGLEMQVGAALFERTTRRVELTPIGADLYQDLTAFYHDLATSLRRPRTTARGLNGKVTVGYLTHCADAEFTRLAAEFRNRFPACEVATIDVTETGTYEVLRDGSVDLLLGRIAVQPPEGLAEGRVMSREDWVLGVARGHPLADRDVVSVEELADYAIFGSPDPLTGKLSNPFYPATTPKGRRIPRPLRPPGDRFRPAARLAAGHPPPGLARARQHRAGDRVHRHRNRRPSTRPATARQPRVRRLARPPHFRERQPGPATTTHRPPGRISEAQGAASERLNGTGRALAWQILPRRPAIAEHSHFRCR
jgi:hypothetical protein